MPRPQLLKSGLSRRRIPMERGGLGFQEEASTSPSVAFSLNPFEERLPRESDREAMTEQPSLSCSQEEELEEAEEESTESEPEPEPMEEEFDGVLREDVIAEALHKLGRSAPGTEHVYLNLSLSDQSLSNIDILSKYVHLEKLDLSYNKINDLSCVSHLPYLLELDVSHNELTTYFDFSPPKNLQLVDFSYNMIPEMRDLSAYQALTKLILDNNNIEEIQGLEKCHSLTYLSLANNRISAIAGLKNLPIKTLCLRSNHIEKAAGLEDLKALRSVDLSSNQISSLEGLEEHNVLEEINLEDNQITELGELEYIETLPLLRVLNLLNNPVQQQADYWFLVIFMLLRLTELDHKKITVQEKVAAVNKYDPPPEVVAAEDHMTHVMYSMMQPQRIFDSTLPSLDAPYPMLVLTGPLACWKRELCHRLCRKFNNYFRYSPCHTTRGAYFGEENRLDYYFVSQEEFDKMVNMGKFIATFKYSGYSYGLGRDTIESIAREGLATCVHMEIEGVRSLKNSYFEPRYILLIPVNKEKYGGHLRRKGLFSRPEIEEAVRRVDMYVKVNEDFPGFFDAVISVDDYDEAFTKLSHLIEEFLGLIQPSESEITVPVPNNNLLSVPSKTASAVQKAASGVKGTDGVVPSPTPDEFMDCSSRNYSSRISAKLSAEKTEVEETSLQRRQHTARQGLIGKAASSYLQLFQREPASTPEATVSRSRFLEPASYNPMMSSSTLTPRRSFPPASPDPSAKESRAATRLSLLSAGPFSSSGSSSRTPVAFNVPSADETNGEQADGKELDHPPKTKEKKKQKPQTTSSHIPQVIVRPGSNTKPVLPPIPSGRKKNKPLVSESHVSPSFLPVPKP
ncbi:leucine-rich repeat and guanylate kinase domain-containing protein isoform X2 [Hemicordylus capensis]|uniref:leucine-rich repeat and guanylate kinase domain-containing protein isoform X2 n=1 Tax=Hemicordylus capensis TaxID=884348 RepID=UPI0023038651|nr:leucine-rich repeat and guanylate kinase domain-containing protein isoform X2 [Hemicordylus capensis]